MPAADDIASELERVRDDYRRLIAAATPEELLAPTRGTRWTKRELLFHMWFGQHLARVFVPLFGGYGRLPRRASIGHARLLTALTRPYNWVNWAGPVAGARVSGLRRAEHWMDIDTDWLVDWGRRATDAELQTGMAVPEQWDPYFTSWMTRADVLEWAPKHYDHHRRQLTLAGRERRRHPQGHSVSRGARGPIRTMGPSSAPWPARPVSALNRYGLRLRDCPPRTVDARYESEWRVRPNRGLRCRAGAGTGDELERALNRDTAPALWGQPDSRPRCFWK